MKAISFSGIFCALAILLTVVSAQAQNASGTTGWLTRLEEAQQQAQAEGKPILMVFAGSDWCKPCIMLRKEVWETAAFQLYAKENLVLLELDFPRFKKNQLSAEQTRYNEELAGRFNKEGSFPLVVLTDAQGKVLAKTGYQAGGPEKYIAHLNALLKK